MLNSGGKDKQQSICPLHACLHGLLFDLHCNLFLSQCFLHSLLVLHNLITLNFLPRVLFVFFKQTNILFNCSSASLSVSFHSFCRLRSKSFPFAILFLLLTRPFVFFLGFFLFSLFSFLFLRPFSSSSSGLFFLLFFLFFHCLSRCQGCFAVFG